MLILKKRQDFLRVAASGLKFAVATLVVQASPVVGEGGGAVGFTATRKLGGAVVRNRVKRRLREAARKVLPRHAAPGYDYVFIGRMATAACPFEKLCGDMEFALRRVLTYKPPAHKTSVKES